MEDKVVKVFELAVACDSQGLYIDSTSPTDRKVAARVLKQYAVDDNKYLALQEFYATMDKALTKLMAK